MNGAWQHLKRQWRLVLPLLLWLLAAFPGAYGQGIVAAEYYWDVDPGPGNGLALSAADLAFDEMLEEALGNVQALPAVGVHTLNFRLQDTALVWGSVYTTVLSVESVVGPVDSLSLQRAEYFWGTDPGPGNGTQLLAQDGNFDELIEAAIGLPVTNPGLGVHRLSVRMQDDDGIWGAVYSAVVAVEATVGPADSLVLAEGEYFWGTDPGQGNGTAMVAFDGNYDEAVEATLNSPVANPGLGVHVLGVRFRDNQGIWGAVYRTVVAIEDTVDPVDTLVMSTGEYFWGADPGQGNGTVMLAFDGNYDQAIEATLNSPVTLTLSLGPHALSIRLQNLQGDWGAPYTTVVWVDTSLVPIVQEIQGPDSLCASQGTQGIVYAVAGQAGATYNWAVTGGTIASGNGSPSITVNWSGIGTHSVEVQGCNADGCGNVFVQTVEVLPDPVAVFSFSNNQYTVTFSNASTNASSYLWNFGDGGSSTDAAPIHVYTQPGDYTVCLQASSLCGTATFCDTVSLASIVPVVQGISGDSTFCENDNLTGLNYAVAPQSGATFNWVISGGVITSGNGTPTVSVDWSGAGTHSLSVQGCNTNGCGNTFVRNVTIAPSPVAGFSSVASQTMVTFTNSSANSNSYLWDFGDGNTATFFNGTHVYNQGGTYVVCLLATGACGTDTLCDTLTVMGMPPMVQGVSGDSTLCENDNLTGLVYSVANQAGVTFNWIVSGGVITSGNGTSTVTVDWSGAGTHSLSVQGCDVNGCGNTFVRNVTIAPASVAAFSFSSNLGTVSFTNNSLNSSGYFWDFGDGNFSNSLNPAHTYMQSGTYQVCLEAAGNCGMDLFCDSVTVVLVGLENPKEEQLVLYPNPNLGRFRVQVPEGLNQEVLRVEVRNPLGQLLWQREEPAGSVKSLEVTLPALTAGTYFLRLIGESAVLQKRFELVK